MHDRTVCIFDRDRRSQKIRHINITATFLAASCGMIWLAGCTLPETVPTTSSASVRVAVPEEQNSHRLVQHGVTAESFGKILAEYRGRPAVVCLWSAREGDGAEVLLEALQWQAGQQGSRLLGVNLDPAQAWETQAGVIWKRMAGGFPCVTIAPGHEQQVLAACGVTDQPEGGRIILLDEAGRLVGPDGQRLAVPTTQAAASAPTSRQAGQDAPASQLTAAPANLAVAAPATQAQEGQDSQDGHERHGTVLVLYTVKVFRLADGARMGEHRGTIVWRDITGKGGQVGLGLRQLGLSRLGQAILQQVGRRGAVAVCPPDCMATGSEGTGLAAEFAEGLDRAIQELGGRTAGQAEVQRVLEGLGLKGGAIERGLGIVRTAIPATFLVTGTVAVSTIEGDQAQPKTASGTGSKG